MAGSTEEGWEDGTAVAGPAYTDAIAQSEPDFESELGTAVAGQDYVENVRRSATAEPVAVPIAAPPVKQGAPRSPTKAFGTPVLLRAPAPTPAIAAPATSAAPERRTPAPLPGMRADTNAIPQPIGMRSSRSTQSRKPAPSKFVDQPFDESERKSGVIAIPDAPTADDRPSRKFPTAAATPLAKERTSGPIERVSERRMAVHAAEERSSGPVVQAPDGRYATPASRLTPRPVLRNEDVPIDDDGEDDDSAGDLDAFDNAETMGQPQRLDSAPVIERRPTPAPLRPTPLPMAAQALPPMPGYLGGAQPGANAFAPTEPAIAITVPLAPPLAPPGALPTSYPMVSADSIQAFKNSPLSSPVIPLAAPAAVVAPRSRKLLIAVSAAVVLALGVGAYVFLLSGDAKPHATAAAKAPPAPKSEIAKPAAKPVAKPDVPVVAKPATAVKTTDAPPPTEIPATTTKVPETPATTTKTPTKTTTKTPAKTPTKTIAKTKAPAPKATRKVVRKVVKKAPAKKAPAKKAPAKPCSGLDCL